MKNDRYRKRIIDAQIEKYLSVFGAICIEGPKWCGKTWTSSFHANSEIYIGDPAGNYQNRRLAQMDPSLVLAGDAPRLIDEWQEVPPLWDAVRATVDRTGQKGQFILTGSSTPNHKGILHSGAGRIARVRMRPMSLYESGASSGKASLSDIIHKCAPAVATGEVKLNTLAELIVRGGWPQNIGLPVEDAALLPRQYIDAILNDDVFRLDGVRRDLTKMRRLLRSLARNECTTATNKTLRRDVQEIDGSDVDTQTISAYLDIFARLFLTDDQPPFSTSMRSSVRVKQAAKRHFCDPSLAAALLDATPEKLMNDLNTFGFLFEALVERDLKVYAESLGGALYHYQDYKDREIDAVVELPGGDWCAVEIKLGANEIEAAAQNLLKLADSFAEDKTARRPAALCVVCGLSNAAYERPDGVYVVPPTALKN